MAEKQTYTGKIKNTGAQKVEGFCKTKTKSTGKVHTGNDLRSK